MNETRFDFVTVVFSADLRLLQLQARSLARFADPSNVGKIHVIVNDACFKSVGRLFRRDVLPEYGALAPKVRLWDYRELWPGGTSKTGWRSQQAVKLLAANLVETENFVILDAKNHLIRPLTSDALITEDGRLRSHMYRIHPGFADHFRRACAYFGYEGEPDLTTGLPTSTPFLMKRDLAQALMAEIEAREHMPFPDYFMESRAFTEFYLYYAYILARLGDVSQLYQNRMSPTATLFVGLAGKLEESIELFKRFENPAVYCMGVHREVLLQADAGQIEMIKDLWARFGLVTDPKEAAYFTTFTKPFPKWRRFLPL
ncbi:DUF6492 family protein [Kordiimonas lipolytica]|uniref:DUF6492 family protein n=1 Tax=Kordiimonas lipolytica TaxID=1662421 RepID=A0ABV8U774_9PROT|nr:DUF6492 family protein [Kordiimonas lipolytica]